MFLAKLQQLFLQKPARLLVPSGPRVRPMSRIRGLTANPPGKTDALLHSSRKLFGGGVPRSLLGPNNFVKMPAFVPDLSGGVARDFRPKFMLASRLPPGFKGRF